MLQELRLVMKIATKDPVIAIGHYQVKSVIFGVLKTI